VLPKKDLLVCDACVQSDLGGRDIALSWNDRHFSVGCCRSLCISGDHVHELFCEFAFILWLVVFNDIL